MTDKHKNGYSLFLLCVFLFGAILAMYYFPGLKKLLEENQGFAIKAMVALVFVSSLLISSANGIVLLPLFVCLFGAFTTLELESFVLEPVWSIRKVEEFLIFMILIPSQFCICNLGMRASLFIRSMLIKDERLSFYNSFYVYIVMLAASLLFAFVHCII